MITVSTQYTDAHRSLSAVPVGAIRNSSLEIVGANTTVISGTCEGMRVGKLLTDPTFFSFNCFLDNLTCRFHFVQNQNQPFALITRRQRFVLFRFAAHACHNTSLTDTCTYPNASASTLLGSSVQPGDYLWTFDSTFPDHVSNAQRDTNELPIILSNNHH